MRHYDKEDNTAASKNCKGVVNDQLRGDNGGIGDFETPGVDIGDMAEIGAKGEILTPFSRRLTFYGADKVLSGNQKMIHKMPCISMLSQDR